MRRLLQLICPAVLLIRCSLSFGVVASIGIDVRLSMSRRDLAIYRIEDRARDTIVSRKPGATG